MLSEVVGQHDDVTSWLVRMEEEENQDGWDHLEGGFEINDWHKVRLKGCGRFIYSIKQLC
jgi:hypothetical protein